MGRKENQTFWRKTPKGKAAGKRYRQSVLGIESRIRNLEKSRDKKKIVEFLMSGGYNTEEMYYAIKDVFPDHTDKQIFEIMKSNPSKRRAQPTAEEFHDSRGIIIPVTGTFPEYYEEGYES